MKSNFSEARDEADFFDDDSAEKFVEAVREIEPSLRKMINRSAGNSHDTDDLLQSTKLLCWEHRGEQTRSFAGWFFIVARNLLYTHHKKRRNQDKILEGFREQLELTSDDQGNPVALNATPTTLYEIEDMFQILPEKIREIYRKHIVEGYTHRELAEEYHIHINTIGKWIKKAKELLEPQFLPKTDRPDQK